MAVTSHHTEPHPFPPPHPSCASFTVFINCFTGHDLLLFYHYPAPLTLRNQCHLTFGPLFPISSPILHSLHANISIFHLPLQLFRCKDSNPFCSLPPYLGSLTLPPPSVTPFCPPLVSSESPGNLMFCNTIYLRPWVNYPLRAFRSGQRGVTSIFSDYYLKCRLYLISPNLHVTVSFTGASPPPHVCGFYFPHVHLMRLRT